jgi:hypothetical protein
MAVTDPYQGGGILACFVAKTEAVAAATLSFASREAGLPTLALAALCPLRGCQGSAKVDGRLLEHLRAHFMAPYQARHLLRDDTARGSDEDAAGDLAALPDVQGIDQIELRPWDLDFGARPLGVEGIAYKPQTFVIGESGRARVASKHLLLLGRWGKSKAEGGMAHFVGQLTLHGRQLRMHVRHLASSRATSKSP